MADLRAAVAAGVLASEEAHRALLQATVEVARGIFHARAASVFLYDEETDELVFEAVAGEGSDTLIGQRLPSSTGIAGWVLVTRQALVLDDVGQDPRWGGREIADKTGYVPKGLMAVPLIHEEEAVGVLNVLDRPQESRFSLEEMELLGLFGNQAAIALDLLQKSRRAKAVLENGDSDSALLARVAENLDALEGQRRAASVELLRSLEALFRSA
ncbi:MAG TPA: GAF domain-containing protein [Gaiellaceae bacterium]|jgi:GAF domain-containing protein|nr:GAF domain-containing protein [Gaiellaceae bacterium]